MFDMNIRVRYSETDPFGAVRLHQILDYFQDTATFHSMALGLDIGGDLVSGHAWYLLSWDVIIHRYPRIGEHINVVTEPYKMKGFYGYRRFYIRDDQGNELVSADSIWVLMDIDKRLPVRISEELTKLFVDPEADDTVKLKRKLPVKGQWQLLESIEITDIFLDSNQHVNNAFYVQWARMVLPENAKVSRLKVDYRQSSLKGDMLKLHFYEEDDVWRVRFTNQEDVLIALVDMHL